MCVCVCVWSFVLTNILVLQLSPQTKIFGSAPIRNYCCSSKIMTPCSFKLCGYLLKQSFSRLKRSFKHKLHVYCFVHLKIIGIFSLVPPFFLKFQFMVFVHNDSHSSLDQDTNWFLV